MYNMFAQYYHSFIYHVARGSEVWTRERTGYSQVLYGLEAIASRRMSSWICEEIIFSSLFLLFWQVPRGHSPRSVLLLDIIISWSWDLLLFQALFAFSEEFKENRNSTPTRSNACHLIVELILEWIPVKGAQVLCLRAQHLLTYF